jgi:hypothetical protein
MIKLNFREENFNPGQWKFLKSAEPYTLFAGGVGSGKTTGLCAKLLQLRGENWGFPGLLVAPSLPMLKGVTLREFRRVYKATFHDRPVPVIRDPQGSRYLDFMDGGEPIYLRTARNPEAIEGFSVGYAGMDEARWCRHEAYRNTIARVRLQSPRPQTVLATTPSMGWLDQEFNQEKEGRKLIVAPTRENIANLRDGYIDDLRISYSPRVQRAILEGEFVPMEGVVFDAFDSRGSSKWITNWTPSRQDLERKPVYMGVDPGWRRSSWLFIIERRPMEWVVFDQLQLDNHSDMSAVDLVNQRGYPIDEIWVDPAADATQSTSGHDTLTVLQHIETRSRVTGGVRVIGNYREIAWGVDKLRVLLGGYEGYPIRMKFTKALLTNERGKQRGIIKDLSAYQYPELKDGRPITDVPLKDGITDHSIDSLRYWAVSRWLVVPELRQREPRLMKDKNLGYKIAA